MSELSEAPQKYNFVKLIALIALIGLIAFLILFIRACDQQEEAETNLIQQVINNKEGSIKSDSLEVVRLKKGIDSLKALAPKLRVIYQTKYDSIYFVQSDTCQQALKAVHDYFSKLDTLNQVLILQQDSVIMKDYKIKLDLRDIINLTKIELSLTKDSLSTLKTDVGKKVRRSYRKGFFHGGLTGAALVEAVNVATKLKP